MSILLLIVSVVQLIKLIKERKTITKLRIVKVTVFAALFYFTFNAPIIHNQIEKIDWKIFYNKRMEIVEQVKQKELRSNTEYNDQLIKLPFDFPVISNGGNEIIVSQNEENDSITVTFYIFRNFFDATSFYFIYTNDDTKKKKLDELVNREPKFNWKIDDNWYRTCD